MPSGKFEIERETMRPPLTSPFTLAADFTFCSSLDSCSSHGFSSLQSPSAFPSFFSNDSSQQIDAFQPLSLDSAELCRCHLRHCSGESTLDITQVDSVSQSNLNILPSEGGPFLHHTDPHDPFCPFHSSSNKTSSRNCDALQKDLGLDCSPGGSLLQESAIAEHSISLPSCPSPLDDTKSSSFLPIQDGYNEKEQPAFSESSSPDPREHSALPPTNDSNDVYSDSAYAFHSQIDKNQHFESFDQTNDTACINAHTTHRCYKNSCIMPLEVVSSALTSSIHSFPTLITRHADADDKENFIVAHINGSSKRRVQLLDNLTPPCSVESKLNRSREGKKEALQEVHENKKTLYSPCKEMFIKANTVDEASKENVSPRIFEQAHKRVGGVKADSNGWMCPKDAKKNFKPKPRQLLLDKWLARQR